MLVASRQFEIPPGTHEIGCSRRDPRIGAQQRARQIGRNRYRRGVRAVTSHRQQIGRAQIPRYLVDARLAPRKISGAQKSHKVGNTAAHT